MGDEAFPPTDRRTNKRIRAFLAVELSSPAKGRRCGVTRNASDQGLLIVTPSLFQAGEDLQVAVHVDGASASVTGRVVRVDENPPSSPELWRYRLAVSLAEPLPEAVLTRAGAQFDAS